MAEENRLFQVEIITPDRVFYTGEGDMIEFTTASGEIGVYKKHIPAHDRVSTRHRKDPQDG